ncbi:MAG: hypothetical protein IK123_00350 [Lachnospiraceae bacterium]|nr:hypothetical protein [Lachnospiraceae bacterium]
MDKFDELMSMMKGVIKTNEEEKKVNVIAIVITALLVVVAIAAAVYAVYRFTQPDFDDDFDDDFGDDDDLDEFFEDEDDEPVVAPKAAEADNDTKASEGAD